MSVLTHLRALHISGSDAEKFLQAQLSCDVSNIQQQAVKAAICAANGRVSALGWLARCNATQNAVSTFDGNATAEFVWYLSRSDADMAFATLSKYKLRAKVQLQLLEDSVYANSAGRFAMTLPDQRLLSIGSPLANDLDANAFLLADIVQRFPSAGGGERFLPQMLGLENLGGLSLKKGCFPGQEVISRLHYKGELKRKLRHFRLDQAINLSEASYTVNEGRDKLEIVQQSGVDFLAVAPIAANEFKLDQFGEVTLQLVS
jgi:tRNA-modifying protein YgfZ